MKKLTRKLFLSICTLAICAVTLVSTTFAWYTTNTEVKASDITGTASATGASSIFISKDSTDKKEWSQSVELELSVEGLVPLQSNGTTFSDLKGTETETGYVSFTLYFKTAKTGANVPLYIRNVTVKNTKSSLENLTAFDNLLNGNSSAAGISGESAEYKVDIADALAMVVGGNVYDLANCNGQNLGTSGFGTVTPDALAYYNMVMGLTGTDDEVKLSSYTTPVKTILQFGGKAIKIADLDKDEAVSSVTFYFYLNGWDTLCFDACKGQSFTVSLEFSSATDITFGPAA